MRRTWIAGGWLIIAAIVFLSLATQAVEINVKEGDKIGHLLAYGFLMAWWSQLYVSRPTRLQLALSFVALGAAMELLQGLTPDRFPEWLDLAADAAGVLLGWLVSPPRIPNLLNRLADAVSPKQP